MNKVVFTLLTLVLSAFAAKKQTQQEAYIANMEVEFNQFATTA